MKKIYLSFALAILILTFGCEMNANHQSVRIENTESGYDFKAEYPKRKTNDVIKYLEKNLKKDDFFNDDQGIKEENVTLLDSTRFHINAEPGLIEISFNKQSNSEKSYHQMVELCQGIRTVLK